MLHKCEPVLTVCDVQGAQHAEQRKAAEDMLKSIAPSLGPILTVPSTFASTHVSQQDLCLAPGLQGHISDCVIVTVLPAM